MRTVVITGASSGIGRAAAVRLAASGDRVVLVGRHPGRLRDAVAEVEAAPDHELADFAVLDQVRRLGAWRRGRYDRIDVLANNAGLLAPRPRRTADGHELTMQVNHLAGYLLTHLLLDRLADDPPGRLITTASLAEWWGRVRPDRVGRPRRRWYSRWLAYAEQAGQNPVHTAEAAPPLDGPRRGADLLPNPAWFAPGSPASAPAVWPANCCR
ncbi:SDR family NAD(P)-dependent oxidoreductase [Micromonospora sp. ATA51]|uniref:SDR family NAD(P)-dependent oxidoreductase n=1 Tax=Micromonospora sp. ATA51 TaxID=2806098 RepID=UPI001A56EBA7|nr:SDR family NAD(P)-dependent oxidoreductase [Micromonospora sp. ATA51]MBM0224395.1 SDR family NAD(P)-dependent oxidoreductase [Micromonospora sp. ATA51]